MPIDPQINPLITFPILFALVISSIILWITKADGRLQLALLLIIGFVIIFFFVSRTALF